VDGPGPVGFVTLRRPRPRAWLMLIVERNPGPVPQTGTAVPGLPWVNSQVTSTRLVRHLPLKCHSIEGGTRLHIRKTLPTWSPLTESNRRPSPYHPQFPGFTARWRGCRAAASDGQAAAVACHAAGKVRLRHSGRARRAAGVKGAGTFCSGPVCEAGCRPVTAGPTVG